MDVIRFMEFDNESLKNFQGAVESYVTWLWTSFWKLFLSGYSAVVEALAIGDHWPSFHSFYDGAWEVCAEIKDYLWVWMLKVHQELIERYPGPWTLKPMYWAVLIVGFLSFIISIAKLRKEKSLKKAEVEKEMMKKEKTRKKSGKDAQIPCGLSVYDLAKTAYEPGRVDVVIDLLKKLKCDVNKPLPENGLTLFLCACISGEQRLVDYMIKRVEADVTLTTSAGDSSLYLATYGVLGSNKDKFGILETLLKAGCDVNVQNKAGYTCLHRAANKGNIPLIKFLLDHGADPYVSNNAGIYPIDSAISASHLDAANLLIINLKNSNVWDIVEPHTPARVELGLQSPRRKHLMESTRRNTSTSGLKG